MENVSVARNLYQLISPFFVTHLFKVIEMIKEIGGELRLETKKREGTTSVIQLPVN
jgi:hypothetical protein